MSEQTDTRRTEGRGGANNGTNGTSNGDPGISGGGISSNGNVKPGTGINNGGNPSNGPSGPAINTNGTTLTPANQDAYQQQQNQFAAQEPFSSWRTANAGPAAPGGNPAAGLPHGAEAYNNFYYGAGAGNPVGYSPFSGDIRDSIAAIWSRTSPSGTDTAGGIHAAAAAFSATAGGYGQFPDNSGAGQYAANSAPGAGQFAANLTGHFATSELGMFGTDAAYGAYGQQYGTSGYAPQAQYTQWPDTQAGSGLDRGRGGNTYSYLGNVQAGDDGRVGLGNNSIRGGGGDQTSLPMGDVQRGIESMKLPGKNSGKNHGESNGYSNSASGGQSSGGSKKMSWASVASQPAKPQPAPAKAKKPGVLAPPTIIPSSKPPVQTPGPQLPLSGEKMVNVGGGIPLQQDMPPPLPPAMQGPPPMNSMKPYDGPFVGGPPPVPPMMPPYHAGGPGMGGPPNHYGVQGPRGGPMRDNGPGGMVNSHGPLQGQGPRNRGTPNGVPPMNMGSGPSNGGGPITSVNPVTSGGPPGKPHPVLESLKSINDYNPKSFDLNPKNCRYFVIKSFSEDDIHRSIKYEIWCSTEHGNKRLDAAYRERNSKGPIYLLFSVNGSGHFCGMAQMLTGVDYSNTSSSVWVQDKFKGQFKVKWIYVKDVPNGQLRHIRLENNENKPVTNSRDTQEVPPEKGKQVLKTIHIYKHTTSIFDDFIHYEKRQEEEEGKKTHAPPGPGINMKNNESQRGGHDGGPHHSGGRGGGRPGERDGHNRGHGGEYQEGPPHRVDREGGHRGDREGGHRGDREGGRRGKPRN